MKKIFLLMLFPVLMIFADDENVDTYINWNLNLNGLRVLVLSDGSIWEACPIKKNKQSWPDWWNAIEPDQANTKFYFNINNWKMDSKVNVYECKWESSELSRIYQYDQKNLMECEYIIENNDTNELVFANKIDFDRLIVRFINYSDQQYRSGYYSGHANGFSSGYSMGSSY